MAVLEKISLLSLHLVVQLKSCKSFEFNPLLEQEITWSHFSHSYTNYSEFISMFLVAQSI